MSRILLTWELGGGLGHLMNLKPLAQGLTAKGHQVTAAVQDVAGGAKIFSEPSVRILQAPTKVRPSQGDPIASPASFAELLMNVGFGKDEELSALVEAWRNIYKLVRPELIIFDHSPSGLFAARGCGARLATIGTGFFCPPPIYPTPNLRGFKRQTSAEELSLVEGTVVGRINRVAGKYDIPPIQYLHQLYTETNLNVLATFPELDHYSERSDGQYWGAWSSGIGAPPQWPETHAPKKRIYAYLKSFSGVEQLLTVLGDSGHSVVVYVDGINTEIQRQYRRPNLRFEVEPLEISKTAAECDLAVLNANHGTSVAMLMAGKPIMLVPLHLEQYILARRIHQIGAAEIVHPDQPAEFEGKLARLLDQENYSISAREFAKRYQGFQADTQIAKLLDQLESLAGTQTQTSH